MIKESSQESSNYTNNINKIVETKRDKFLKYERKFLFYLNCETELIINLVTCNIKTFLYLKKSIYKWIRDAYFEC
jgi:hypothetical protein